MDHIKRPSDVESDQGPIEVPCLCTQDYEGYTFLEYPERRGISLPDLILCDIEVRASYMVDFVQTWLFFGLLSAVLEREVTIAEYTRTDSSGILLIDTSCLLHDLGEWVVYLKHQSRSSCQEIERRISHYMHMSFRVLAALEKMTEVEEEPGLFYLREKSDRAEDFQGILPPTVDISIKLLLDAITSAPRIPNLILLDLPNQWSSNRFLRMKLRDAGYCPHIIAQMKLPLLCYASLIKPKGRVVDHKKSCTVQKCVANNVSGVWLPDHVESGCECAMVSFDMKEVVRILKRGGIPLVGSSFDSAGHLTVIEGDPSKSYTAISHVFADGLGNTEANALPLCQVERIRKLVFTLPRHDFLEAQFGLELGANIRALGDDSMPFWIDTLCVPVESVSKAVRRLAIKEMRKVYQDAANVLVLDRSLQQSDGNASATECLFRTITSTWCSRLWTLQEANLASEIHFVFKGKLREGFKLIREHLQETDFDDHKPLVLLDMIQWMPHFERSTDVKRMKVLFTALQYRVTSWRYDEAICIAILLGQDPDPLLDPAVTPATRFTRLISQLQEVPADMLFLRGEKLTTPGYRWSPSSLMVPDSDRFVPLSGDRMGFPCDRGLWIACPGILIKPLPASLPSAADQLYVMNEENTVSYGISFDRGSPMTNNIWKYATNMRQDWAVTAAGMNLAVILRSELAPGGDNKHALLCEVVGDSNDDEDNSLLFVHILQAVNVQKASETLREEVSRSQRLGYNFLGHGELIYDCCILHGQDTPLDQFWCVD